MEGSSRGCCSAVLSHTVLGHLLAWRCCALQSDLCCPELGSFSASRRGGIAFFVGRINVACNHFATLPDLQVKPCLFPAMINKRNMAKDNTEGKE